jgi:hypothetical protein
MRRFLWIIAALMIATMASPAFSATRFARQTWSWDVVDTQSVPRLQAWSISFANDGLTASQPLRLELWVFPTEWTCTNNLAGGIKLWQLPVPALSSGGTRSLSGPSEPIATLPPQGTYYAALVLTEYDPSYGSNDGFRPNYCEWDDSPRAWSAATAPLSIQNGVWWSAAESGSGYAVHVSNGVLVMQIYSYRADGEPQWYLTAGPLTNGNRSYTGTLDKYRSGQCITCTYRAPTIVGNDGAVAIEFHTGTTATMTLPGGRRTSLELFAF